MYFRGKDCSKNNSLLERVDPRLQHIWRLRVMGSWLSKTEGKLKSLVSENDQIDRSPISRARYLYREIGNAHF